MYDEYPKDRATAKATGAKHYFTGQPCKHGHVALRKTKGSCVECILIAGRNPTPGRQKFLTEYLSRPEVKTRRRKWYEANKELTKARANARAAHLKRLYRAKWKENNQDAVNSHTAKRRAQKHRATPPWLTPAHHEQIKALYAEALHQATVTGQEHDVDHIYPLKSVVVCGLHVPWNLRVISKSENLSKSNKLPEDTEALAYPSGAGPSK